MDTGRIGAENALVHGIRSGTPANAAAPPGSGNAEVNYSAFQLDALRRAADVPHAVPSTGVGDAVPPPGAGSDIRLRWAAEQLEALFVHELLKSMRRTVMKAGMFDGLGVKMFEEMLDEERSKEMAAAGGLGLARLIYDQLAPHVPAAPDVSAGPARDGGRTTRSAEEPNLGGDT